jgi:hypothetical protein
MASIKQISEAILRASEFAEKHFPGEKGFDAAEIAAKRAKVFGPVPDPKTGGPAARRTSNLPRDDNIVTSATSDVLEEATEGAAATKPIRGATDPRLGPGPDPFIGQTINETMGIADPRYDQFQIAKAEAGAAERATNPALMRTLYKKQLASKTTPDGTKKSVKQLHDDAEELKRITANEASDTAPVMREQGGREVIAGGTGKPLTEPSAIPKGTPVTRANQPAEGTAPVKAQIGGDLPPERRGKAIEESLSVESASDRIFLDDLDKVIKEDAKLKADMDTIIGKLSPEDHTPENIRALARERAEALQADIAALALQGKRIKDKKGVDRPELDVRNRNLGIDKDVRASVGSIHAALGQKKILPAIAGETEIPAIPRKEAVERYYEQIAQPAAQAAAKSGRQIEGTPIMPPKLETRQIPSSLGVKAASKELIEGPLKKEYPWSEPMPHVTGVGRQSELFDPVPGQLNAPTASPIQQQQGAIDEIIEQLTKTSIELTGKPPPRSLLETIREVEFSRTPEELSRQRIVQAQQGPQTGGKTVTQTRQAPPSDIPLDQSMKEMLEEILQLGTGPTGITPDLAFKAGPRTKPTMSAILNALKHRRGQ